MAIAQRVCQIPPYTHENDVLRKMAPLKLIAIVALPLFVLDHLSGRSYPKCVPNENLRQNPIACAHPEHQDAGHAQSCRSRETRKEGLWPSVRHHHICEAWQGCRARRAMADRCRTVQQEPGCQHTRSFRGPRPDTLVLLEL